MKNVITSHCIFIIVSAEATNDVGGSPPSFAQAIISLDSKFSKHIEHSNLCVVTLL